jgi:hypothetical protein
MKTKKSSRVCVRLFGLVCSLLPLFLGAQVVPIQQYSIGSTGQVQLKINSSANKYYILKVRSSETGNFDMPTSMTLGVDGTTLITEPLGAYPIGRYQIIEHSKSTPADTDQDGLNDITEYNQIPQKNPLNAAPEVAYQDGVIRMDSFGTYKRLSLSNSNNPFAVYLNGLVFVKYMISNFYGEAPRVYFINTNLHALHQSFGQAVGENHLSPDCIKGEIIFNPTSISSNGTLGTFAFNYTGGHGADFHIVRRTHELLAANMPLIKNNLSYFVTENSTDEYARDQDSFTVSRIPILLESDVFADINYWGLNIAEGYGLLRPMDAQGTPNQKDIVLYESLPNDLPRVGGIITSVIQTPLSHVNLRAIQNKIPNAFIRDPLEIDSIAKLIGHYIYFKVEQNRYVIREASLDEVNAWYEKLRPLKEQTPPLNLSHQSILPLAKIGFRMFDGYGAKCANVATMRTFGFPEGTIPDGVGVPFYFYQEFMKYNHFFDEVRTMLLEKDFRSNIVVREERLSQFRKKIKNATMPDWMLRALDTIPLAFTANKPIRCRSSSNNEDLPDFNGAGLYTSKTHYPTEGHISKTIKQVYASLWNLGAFDEREFYRVNHYTASMGVLCHENFTDEKANGVGVSADPLYNTVNTFYLNTQLGEALITNPDTATIPEELLLDKIYQGPNDYLVISRSNLVPKDSLILSSDYMPAMRTYLTKIHDEFKKRYHADNSKNFAMDIEYKISKSNQLVIKQARPWAGYDIQEYAFSNPNDYQRVVLFPNPANQYITLQCDDCRVFKFSISNTLGHVMKEAHIKEDAYYGSQIYIGDLPIGVYYFSGYSENNGEYLTASFLKH